MTVKKHNQAGFTLLETMVAISILLVAVVGPISLLGNSLNHIYFVRDQMIAVNLAQESIEAVRSVRDTNMLSGSSWDTGLAAGIYTIDARGSGIPAVCGGCSPQPVVLDANGFYRQGVAGTPTVFSRIMTIESGFGANERKVTSVVTWKTGSTQGAVSISESIFKWAQS